MRNKVIICIVIFLAILGILCWVFSDDLDNLKTSINAKPMEIVPLVGEMGTSLSKEGNVFSSYISPGKLEINNAFREANPEFVFKIRNGTSNSQKYSISPRSPDVLEEGYSVAPLSWISLEEKEITILAGETREILVTTHIPKQLPSKKLMFWLSVKGSGSSGMMKVELCSKIMINIR